MANENQTTLGKAILIGALILLVIIAWIILGQLVFKLQNHWVGLVALTMFGAVYSNNLSDAPKVWIGSAIGLLLAYLLWYLPSIMNPVAGAIIVLTMIAVLLGGLISQKLPIICNFPMFMMLTIAANIKPIMDSHEHLYYLQDLLYGAICFWIIPSSIIRLKKMKGPKIAEPQ